MDETESPKAAMWRANLERLIRASGTRIEAAVLEAPAPFQGTVHKLPRLSASAWRAIRLRSREKRVARMMAGK
jgi:hypothetical protein